LKDSSFYDNKGHLIMKIPDRQQQWDKSLLVQRH
jgi:hypothetical protein